MRTLPLAVLVLLALAPAAHGAESLPSILTWHDFENGVFVVEAGHKTEETNGTLIAGDANAYPSFAPDGKRIAFLHYNDRGTEAWVRVVNRSGAILREDIPVSNSRGTGWSPDGVEVAYGCTIGDTSNGVCAANVETGATRVIETLDGDDHIFAFNLASFSWASDNSAIAFTVDVKKPCDPGVDGRCGQWQVVTTHPVSGGVRELTHADAGAWGPSFSPDAQRLAYYERSVGVMVGGPDGGGSVIVAYDEMADPYALPETAWSPDGTRVLFLSTFDPAIAGNANGFAVKADGSSTRWDHEIATFNTVYHPNWAQAIPGCTIPGTPEPDALDGTEGGDVICGEGGNDTIDGKGGADSITGGPGNDTIVGGAGTDSINGDGGDDTIDAVDGEIDTVACGAGLDTLRADPADDVDADCENATRSTPDNGGGPGGGTGSGGGGPGGAPPLGPATIQPDVSRPALAAAKASPRKVKAGKVVTLAFSLSESAAVEIDLARSAAGRKVAGKCRKLTGSNRRKPKCKRFVDVRHKTEVGTAGANELALPTTGLKPGGYRVKLTAEDAAGNASAAQSLRFKVTRRTRGAPARTG